MAGLGALWSVKFYDNVLQAGKDHDEVNRPEPRRPIHILYSNCGSACMVSTSQGIQIYSPLHLLCLGMTEPRPKGDSLRNLRRLTTWTTKRCVREQIKLPSGQSEVDTSHVHAAIKGKLASDTPMALNARGPALHAMPAG
jgi:hypothetical protein